MVGTEAIAVTCVDSESANSLDWQQDATERKTCDPDVPPRGGGAADHGIRGADPRLPETESQQDFYSTLYPIGILY